MSIVTPLSPDRLRKVCDPASVPFDTTAEIEVDGVPTMGWERALEAASFGIEIDHKGYNLYASGTSGLGKRSTLLRLIERRAASDPPPPDWCYVNDFEDESQPAAIALPAGRGRDFKRRMENLLSELRSAIPAVFESEDYQTRRQLIEQSVAEKKENAFEQLHNEARQRGLALLRTPMGLAFAPVRDGDVITPQDYQKLSPEEREKYESSMQELQGKLQPILWQIPRWEQAGREELRKLNREMTTFAAGHLIEVVRKEFGTVQEVIDYLAQVERVVAENPSWFLHKSSEEEDGGQLRQSDPEVFFRRFEVNLVVDNSEVAGAPVIYEDHPTYANLIGLVEHRSSFGALTTDFTLIKAGSIQRANGGYLVIDADKVLPQPQAWEALKRVIRSGQTTIESLGQALSLIATTSLKPRPIPIRMKVVLIGTNYLHYLLSAYDPEFQELFKVLVDFSDQAPRHAGNQEILARVIGSLAHSEGVRPVERSGIARLIEHASRMAGDSEKLSTHLGQMRDLLIEANHFAGKGEATRIDSSHVEEAIAGQKRRADRYREYLFEQLVRGTLLIDTSGEQIGQINGLSVLSLGRASFGRPSRITARVRQGKGVIVDIEREVDLGGPLHSKGVMILSSFLGARFLPQQPLSLRATLVFEQSYGGVDGDSASCAELYALLSALADVPIRQSLAVTGSVNQYGQVQAIGGVNEKIEGFFELCRQRGLTGDQGVLIPASNVVHLMLHQEVVEACASGRFHVYAVDHVDQGIELLTGVPAGRRQDDGEFEADSINARVEARLKEFSGPAKDSKGEARDRSDEDSDNSE